VAIRSLAPGTAPPSVASQKEEEPGSSRFTLPDVTGDRGTTLVAGAGFAVGPASGAQIPIVPREAWGADESYRFKEDGSERWHEMFVTPRKLVIHHTATRNAYGPGESAADVRAIYHYHANEQGWGDIGYNALIDRWGAIYEGRHSRGGDPGDPLVLPSRLNADVSGGHTKWHNYGSAGVALLGDAEVGGWGMYSPSGPMWESLVAYATFVSREANLRPLGADGRPRLSPYLTSDDRWHEDGPAIGGHTLFEATLCPGDVVLALIPALREAVHAGLTETSRSGVVLTGATPPEREVAAGTVLAASWSPEAPEPGWSLMGCEYRWEAWFKPQDQDDITYLSGFSNDFQPLARWLPAPPGFTSTSILAAAPGHYTLHVRPVVQRGGVRRSAAFSAAHTWLVR
jgi:hypothetical protein